MTPAQDPRLTFHRKSTGREYFESILIAVLLALFARTFVVQAFKIPTGSMEPNLLVGDHLLVNKFVFGPSTSALERAILPMRDLRRGDIAVFKYPEDPARDFIKRVVGLPGDTIEVRNKKVHVNGTPLEEPYAHFIYPPAAAGQARSWDLRETYGPVTVPADQLFMMGDNRDNSQDSRFWGFLPRDFVKGRALVIYWSFDEEAGATGNIFSRTRWDRLLNQIR
ncbi:MAG: signal peptidase I [Acidobacteriota bacterium]|nr:signal peptidase I [Acidobacteriota bacterium]